MLGEKKGWPAPLANDVQSRATSLHPVPFDAPGVISSARPRSQAGDSRNVENAQQRAKIPLICVNDPDA